jgi:hypothetical protein
MKVKSHHKQWILPTIECHARLTNGIEWVCPDCGYPHSYGHIKWRDPFVKCRRKECKHRFPVGIAMGMPEEMGTQPANCRVLPPPTQHRKRNYAGLPKGEVGFARMRGGLEWLCTRCGSWAYSHPEWETGVVACPVCQAQRGTAVILHHGNAGKRVGSPVDWTPPRGFYVESPEHAMVIAEARQSGRATGRRVRDVGEAETVGIEGAR